MGNWFYVIIKQAMEKQFRIITESEFKSFAEQCPSKNYMQSLDMYKRYQAIGRESYLVGLVKNDVVLVAGIVSVIYERLGQKIFTFSRGPIANYANMDDFLLFLDECKKFLKAKHGIILQISPNLLSPDAPKDFDVILKKHGFKNLGEYEQVKWTYALDFAKIENLPFVEPASSKSSVLDPPISKEAEQILMHSFRRDHRYTIRYATERYDIRLRELPVAEYPILLDMIQESGKVHGFVPREQKFFEQLKQYFGSDVTAIVAELPDGTPIAAAFFILYGNEVIYLSSGFRRDYKKLGAPHLIQWAMIKYAYANGFKKYNFWGTNPDPENGVFKFKQGFHGEIEEFVGTYATAINSVGKVYLRKLHYAKQRDL